MREQFRQITINFAPVKVIGIPGLSLVLIAVALVLEFPAGRWLLLAGIAGGALVGLALILIRRRQAIGSDSHPGGRLMACDLPSTRQDGWSSPRRSASEPASLPAPSSRSPRTNWASGFNGWRLGPGW